MTVARYGSFLIVLAVLAACSTPQANRGVSLTPQDKSGLVVASFPQFLSSKVTWKYRKLGSSGPDQSIEVTGRGPNAIVAGDRVVFALALPEGEYEFFGWSQAWGGMIYWSPKEFSIRFRSSPGKATYIGSLGLYMDAVHMKTFNMDAKDLAAWDVPVFLRTYPNVSASQVEVAIMHRPEVVVAPTAYLQPPAPPSVTLVPMPDGAADGATRTFRFQSAERTTDGASVSLVALAEKRGDAMVFEDDSSAGVITLVGQAGLGGGSRWGAVGLRWSLLRDGKGSYDASGFKRVTFRLASTGPSLRLILDAHGVHRDCDPTLDLAVTPELKEYTIPLERFTRPSSCEGATGPVADALRKLDGIEVLEATSRGRPVAIGVGATTFSP